MTSLHATDSQLETTDAHLDRFREYLFEQGLQPSTIASYVTDIRQFHAFLAQTGERHPFPPTRWHISRFRSYLLDQRLKVATFNKKINSLAAYERFLHEEGILDRPIVHRRRDRMTIAAGSERQADTFTEQEVTRILFYVQQPSYPMGNRLIVEMLLYTGVRVSELCNIRLADLDLLTHTLRVTGKGGTYRDIPLKPELIESIQRYLRGERKESRFVESPYLLLSQRVSKLHRDAVNRLLKTLGDELGMRICLHKFCHTLCCWYAKGSP